MVTSTLMERWRRFLRASYKPSWAMMGTGAKDEADLEFRLTLAFMGGKTLLNFSAVWEVRQTIALW